MKIGIDIGSTTIKYIVLDAQDHILQSSYERHYSQIVEKTLGILKKMKREYAGEELVFSISGSAGMGIAETLGIPFIQEVYATRAAVKRLLPSTDVVIELGGEDAKILFLTQSTEVRMNGSCAGGTGAFVDQMAALLDLSLEEMNEEARRHEKIYTIASRCGVFAKTDIQPLLNQGAQKSDIAASIFMAVVNQTIGGLAQGRLIEGNVVYLGGPLTFLSELRRSFDNTLHLEGICPENSLYYVALGAAFSAEKGLSLPSAIHTLEHYKAAGHYDTIPPLFQNEEQLEAFQARHSRHTVAALDPLSYEGDAYLGIDAGSTTLKMVVMSPDKKILHSVYGLNSGNPVPLVQAFLQDFYRDYPKIKLRASCVTGYGEEIIKNAFSVDFGIVETIAHFTAAREFLPDVEFIIDIGGQDIKCFKVKNGVIDNIYLNEACSSGCGSFLQTFAQALGYSVEEFAKLGLLARHPVDLGSRCTVFMNSSVKQAQKDGAAIEDISAGLSISVVKNALYKVIRASGPEDLGSRIVVQGGTFFNDAVLRAFEQEMKTEVIRPSISGLMGAYGAALLARKKSTGVTTLLSLEALANFTHAVKAVNCGLCSNHCQLTVNQFSGGRSFIAGNRCERPVTKRDSLNDEDNIYQYKMQTLEEYRQTEGVRGVIGIPMVLNMYELYPFWHRFFTELGFTVVRSPFSSRKLYLKGQGGIPSDTVCFPAKLAHGHIQWLIEQKVDAIFYPCMTYNLKGRFSEKHFNCPVVAYYPETIEANTDNFGDTKLINDFVGLHNPKDFQPRIRKILMRYGYDCTAKEIRRATNAAFLEYDRYFDKIRSRAREILTRAQERNRQVIVLAGRPYHVDPEVNHGIDRLITSLGFSVVSEDSICEEAREVKVKVLNQWTYHTRLYAAAKYIENQPNLNLVQLVSFGCGLDAITADEVRRILEEEGKIYTIIKIDEITNLGAVKIRLRSLMEALQG